MGIPGCTVAKNLPARAGDTRDTGSIPGIERSPGEEHSSIPASQNPIILSWKILWTEETDGLQYKGSQKTPWISHRAEPS